MIYSDLILWLACQESNRIEGESITGLSFNNHYRAALLARTSATHKQLLHPLVLHQLLFEDIPIGEEFQQVLKLGDYRPMGMNVYVKQEDGSNHRFPDSMRVPALMEAWWAEWCNSPDIDSSLVRWWFHAWYEAIHPQYDGNGRVGRLLWWNMTMIAGQELDVISYDGRVSYYRCLEAWRADHCNKPDMNPFR